MLGKKRSHVKVIVAITASVLLFGFAGWLLFNRQYVIDQVSVWAYKAPANIQTIEERISLSGSGKFYFRATQPTVASAADFNQDCPRQEPNSPILGCYGEGRIYIYDVTNDQLEGIEEVTAAHEMLHAVWERTSPSEQKRIGSLLRTEYARLSKGELKDRMDYYARTEPGQFENELHSIIGTEVPDISAELEQYYSKFFGDRQKVIGFHVQYSTKFTSLRDQADSMYEQLTSLNKSIETRSAQYAVDVAKLSSDIQSFNARAGNSSFSSIAQFNRERAALVARSNQLDNERNAINDDIARYQQLYTDYEKVAVQIEVLNSSIDSIKALAPAPSL